MLERDTCDKIQNRLIEICEHWNLLDKIFCYSIDNTTTNIRCMEHLYNELAFSFILGGRLLHILCCGHIINLSCQVGIIKLSDSLDPIRDIVKCLRLEKVKRRYKQLRDHFGLKRVYLSRGETYSN